MNEVVEVRKKRTTALEKATNISVFYLEGKGAKILERNCTGTLGRVELIYWEGSVLVFATVKTRYSGGYQEKDCVFP